MPVAMGKVDRIELPGGVCVLDQSFPFIDLGPFTEGIRAGLLICGLRVDLAGEVP